MTDRETVCEMLARASLPYTEGERTETFGETKTVYDAITVEDRGYVGFVSQFWFDKATGALKHMAAWE